MMEAGTATGACALGALAAYLIAHLTEALLRRDTRQLGMALPFVRQVLNIAFLLALWGLSAWLGLPPVWALAGGVLGLTVCSTVLLLRMARREAAREAANRAGAGQTAPDGGHDAGKD